MRYPKTENPNLQMIFLIEVILLWKINGKENQNYMQFVLEFNVFLLEPIVKKINTSDLMLLLKLFKLYAIIVKV